LSVAHLKAQRERAGSGGTAALIVLPTASGKSEIIIEDISSFLYQQPDAKVAVVSPTVNVANKWHDAFTRHNLPVHTGTYHLLWELYRKKTTETYDYLCIDEAHHAISPMTRKALMYLNPTFLVGLTATPERLDRRRLEDVFGSYNTGLSLTEAMEKGIINTLRVLRVETNLDLREVRFNGRDYVNADLEKRIEVPTRDETIAKVLKRYFHAEDIKGVIFCVSVRHADKMAKVLGKYGIKARSVSSQDHNAGSILEEFSNREFNFLCSVNMLNEGWDEPGINVMVMARPTMSKVLYMQQLGRGLRRSEIDGETFVIDVVDQYGHLARPWSAHALFNTTGYVPFGDITRSYQIGDSIEYLGITEQILSITEVDPITYEKLYGEYLSIEESARQLFINTGTLNSWIRSHKVAADLTLPFGARSLRYFAPESIARIRQTMGLKEHSLETIKADFFEFLESKSYTYSFKMVFLLSFLDGCDANGEAGVSKTLDAYCEFYRDRLRRNLPVDRDSCVYTETYLSDTVRMQKSMLDNPFEKFERKRFIYYGKDVALLSFHPRLWEELTAEDISGIRGMMREHLKEYYTPFGGL
ncbi:MAG: DEAD/DEAH box helicase, partial [Sphaerochaetaceae bacterium]|nr:DEAD/DEAH box helicase [Sphaerochaetaceae bacterium]